MVIRVLGHRFVLPLIVFAMGNDQRNVVVLLSGAELL